MQVRNPLRAGGPLAREHPKVYLAAYVGGGVILVALMMWAFAGLADEIPEQGWMERVDHAIVSFIHAHETERGESFFVAVSLLGGPILAGIVAIVTIALALRRDWLRAAVVALSSASGAGLNTVLKQVFHRGRPEYASEFIPHQSWSFPSGHAMDSIVAYGIMLYLVLGHIRGAAQRRLLVAATAVLLILIASARVYLGVHYPSDVIAGWLAGGAWLIICLGAYRLERRRLMSLR